MGQSTTTHHGAVHTHIGLGLQISSDAAAGTGQGTDLVAGCCLQGPCIGHGRIVAVVHELRLVSGTLVVLIGLLRQKYISIIEQNDDNLLTCHCGGERDHDKRLGTVLRSSGAGRVSAGTDECTGAVAGSGA